MNMFNDLKIERPEPISNAQDDLQRPLIKVFKHIFRIFSPYFWGPKHTDIWSIGRFVSKISGKRILDAQCADGAWLAIPLPVYTSHFLEGPDHKRYNKDNITPIMKQYASKGSVAIDVGASCGQEVVALSKAVGDSGMVYCFEPSFSYNALVRTVGLNQLKNVVCVHAGCADQNGYVEGDSDQPYLTGDLSVYSDSGIPVIRLDDFLNHIGESKPVSLIKIDTDGFEYEVIKGAAETIKAHSVKVIAEFELHFDYSGAKGADVLRRYIDEGFEVRKVQTSSAPLNGDDLDSYISDMRVRENMIAHDLVLERK